MTVGLPGALARLRRPEYTGENRCTPCTVVNVVIAVLLAGGLAVAAAVPLEPPSAGLVGAAAFAVFAAAIYLRGYLVPGTPRLTETYFPDWLLRWFEKAPAQPATTPEGDVDAEAVLKQADAVEECEREDDLCLTDGFRSAWRDRIGRLREDETSREDLATVLDVDPDRLSFEEYGDAFVALLDGDRKGQWESQAAFLADVAAANELRSRTRGWATLDVRQRSSILEGLRIFLETCPACDGPTAVDHEVVKSCCRSTNVTTLECGDCGARLVEAEVPQS